MKKIMSACGVVSVAVAIMLAVAVPSTALTASDTYENRVIYQTNNYRVKYGKVAVRSQWCVDKYAEAHARWMAAHQSLTHQSMSRVLRGCNLSRVGENIGRNYSTPLSLILAWLASTGHRANLLNYRFRYIGVGAYQDSRGKWWVAQVFGTP
jgi:uncharacterized protein YkwD